MLVARTRRFEHPAETGSWASKAFKKVKKVAKKIPGTATITAPLKMVKNVAQGKNVIKSIKQAGRETVADTRKSLPIAASVASFIPGIGTGVAAGLSAATALSEGKGLRGMVEEAALGAIPGGKIARAAVKAGIGVAKGQNVLKTLGREGLELGKQVVPGGKLVGEAIESGVRAGIGIAKGQNVAKTLAAQGIRYARGAAPGGQLMQSALNVAEQGIAGRNILKAVGREGISLAKSQLPGGELMVRGLNVAQAGLSGQNILKAAAREGVSYAGGQLKSQLPGVPNMRLLQTLSRPDNGLIPSMAPELVRAARSTVGVVRPNLRPVFNKTNPKAAFRPLAVNTRNMLVRALPHMRGEVSGLSETGAQWIVEKGDTGSKIALKLTGNANRWTELRAINPQVMGRGAAAVAKYGFPIYVGDRINLPSSWIKVTAQTPAMSAPATASTTTAPPVQMPGGDLAAQGQSRTILAAWGKSDGASEAGVPDYGSAAELNATGWTARDTLQANAFAHWWRRNGGPPAVADGQWSDSLVQALNAWAEQKAKQVANSALAAGGVVIPSLALPTPPSVAPTVTPSAPSGSTPTQVPTLVTPSLPGVPSGQIVLPTVVVSGGGATTSPAATQPTPTAGTQAAAQAQSAGSGLSDQQKWAWGSAVGGGLVAGFVKTFML
jgi:hypothetical protein